MFNPHMLGLRAHKVFGALTCANVVRATKFCKVSTVGMDNFLQVPPCTIGVRP